MISGIVMIYDDTHDLDFKKHISNFSDEHQRIIDLVVADNKIVFEKDNSAIEDVLNAFNKLSRSFVKECPEIVKDTSIGYCIIPIRDYELP